jgi:hypothetical protein
MMASATDSTITMAVAAERPPTKATMVSRSGLERQRQHEHVAVELAGRESQKSCRGDWNDEQIDQHEIDRKHPAGAPDLPLVIVLDDSDVKLPRQQQDCDERQQRTGQQHVKRRLAAEHRRCQGRLHSLAEQRHGTVEHPECDKNTDCQKRYELDDGLRCDRQHQPVLMLGRVDVPSAEQHGEDRHG